jgi:hypothetical protein
MDLLPSAGRNTTMRKGRRRAALGIAAVVAVAAVGAGEAISSGATRATADRDCTATEARSAFDVVLTTFNSGDVAHLDEVIAPGPSFVWFSDSGVGQRLGDKSKDRSTLARYFKQRHRQRDRLTVVSWHGGGNSNGYSHFQFVANRSSLEELPSRYEGKGAVICDDSGNRIAVWSMGRKAALPLTASPAQLRSGNGWLVGTARITNPGCAGCVQTESWASTIRYRDPPNQLPPHRTMAAMHAHDIVVHVTRAWEPSPPLWTLHRRPLRIDRPQITASFEGNTTRGRVSLWEATTWRAGSFVSVWVLFGTAVPTAADMVRAQTELNAAVFAPWKIPR